MRNQAPVCGWHAFLRKTPPGMAEPSLPVPRTLRQQASLLIAVGITRASHSAATSLTVNRCGRHQDTTGLGDGTDVQDVHLLQRRRLFRAARESPPRFSQPPQHAPPCQLGPEPAHVQSRATRPSLLRLFRRRYASAFKQRVPRTCTVQSNFPGSSSSQVEGRWCTLAGVIKDSIGVRRDKSRLDKADHPRSARGPPCPPSRDGMV